MDIVFIHHNYPAQFKHLAAALGKTGNHRVIFLTNREDASKEPIKGVEIKHFELHRNANPQTHHYLIATEKAVLSGQAVIRELHGLILDGLNPEIIISHAGMGLGLFIKDLIPHSIHIGFFEWYFKPETAKWLMVDFQLNQKLATRTRNLPILEELNSCDIGVVPTQWQKKQFPNVYHHKLKIIFDGIDQNFFNIDKTIDQRSIRIRGEENDKDIIIQPKEKILSYATRGMETLRGFPEFLNMAIECVQEFDNLKVIIAGRDRRAYSYDAPNINGSWKKYILEKHGDFLGQERIIFSGLMPYAHYKLLLQRSNLHCYFTRPYVTSWSLFEAASSGARLCVNKTEATSGIVESDKNVIWVDLDNQNKMIEIVKTNLRQESTQRNSLRKEFYLANSMKQWGDLINSQISKKRIIE